MTTLAGIASYPDGTPTTFGKVTVRLVAAVDGLAPGYDGARGIYGLSHAKVASDGSWRVEGLTANDDPDLLPAGTVYEVLVQVPGRPVTVTHARLTTAGGAVQQLRDVLSDPPAALPSSALAGHLARPHPAGVVDTLLDRWDDFDRPDSALSASAVMPSGQVWTVATSPTGDVASLVIRNRSLYFDVAGASYVRVGGHDFARFLARFSFGPGDGIGAAVAIISSKRPVTDPATGVTGIATNSVHAVFGPDTWSVGIFDGLTDQRFASSGLDPAFDYPPLAVDQPYRAGIERLAADRIRIHLPDGRSIDKTDADIAARTGLALKLGDWWGPTALIEHYQPAASFATDRRPAIHEVAVSGTGHQASDSHTPTDPWHVVGAAGEPAFTAPWRAFGAPFQVPRFRKAGQLVYLDGVAGHDAAANGSTAFVLPAGYHPASTVIPYAFARLDVDAAGNVVCRNVSAGSFHPMTCSFWVD